MSDNRHAQAQRRTTTELLSKDLTDHPNKEGSIVTVDYSASSDQTNTYRVLNGI